MIELVRTIEQAFASRAYPGDLNVTHCTYDKKNGGTYDGPCGECQEVLSFFRGKSWRDISPHDLFLNGQADALFTIAEYCYLLPGYLVSALRSPNELDVCVDHISYRFGPKVGDAFGEARLESILTHLTEAEVKAVLEYFKHSDRQDDFDGYRQRSIENLECVLAMRSNPSSNGRADARRST